MGNILLSEKLQIKVADLGLAAKLDNESEKRHTLCGTPNYVAPEVIDLKKYGGHSYESDVWSFGCILYAMLCGKAPFETDDVEKTYQRIRNCLWEFPQKPVLSDQAKSIIKSILVLQPDKRPTIDQLLNSDFF
jgi:serine/threonine protein kinase